MARVILANNDCRRPFFGNSSVVVFLVWALFTVVSATLNCRRAISNCRRDFAVSPNCFAVSPNCFAEFSGLPTLEKANPLGVASNQDHGLLFMVASILADLVVDAGSTLIGLRPRQLRRRTPQVDVACS